MRYVTLVLALIGVSVLGCSVQTAVREREGGRASESDRELRRAFEERARNLRVEGRGVVRQVLADDNEGSRHQRFILDLDSGQTLLVAHNVDVAPRIPGLREGDGVEFRGEYEWNPEGGVVHWTHDDPGGRHPGGWLKHKGKTYR